MATETDRKKTAEEKLLVGLARYGRLRKSQCFFRFGPGLTREEFDSVVAELAARGELAVEQGVWSKTTVLKRKESV